MTIILPSSIRIFNLFIMKRSFFTLLLLSFICLLYNQETIAQDKSLEDNANVWQSPEEDILKILYAPQLPRTSTSPSRTHMVLKDPIIYPTLSELAGPMLKLAGTRVNPKNNYYHGRHGGTSPRVLTIKDGKTVSVGAGQVERVGAVEQAIIKGMQKAMDRKGIEYDPLYGIQGYEELKDQPFL